MLTWGRPGAWLGWAGGPPQLGLAQLEVAPQAIFSFETTANCLQPEAASVAAAVGLAHPEIAPHGLASAAQLGAALCVHLGCGALAAAAGGAQLVKRLRKFAIRVVSAFRSSSSFWHVNAKKRAVASIIVNVCVILRRGLSMLNQWTNRLGPKARAGARWGSRRGRFSA